MSLSPRSVAVLGGGYFGTVIADLLARNGHRTRLWLRDQRTFTEITQQQTNSRYLPHYKLSPALEVTTHLSAISDAQYVFVVVPSSSCRQVARQLAQVPLADKTIVVSAIKGIETKGFTLMSQVLAEELPNKPIAVLSGPNLSGEIAERHITATVVAHQTPAVASQLRDVLNNDYFRVYTSQDIRGVEWGGVLKNVYALIAGFIRAQQVGHNSFSMFIARALAEMSRFAHYFGAHPITFLGLSGVGDLILTCTSEKSRNYRVGYALGQGQSLSTALKQINQTVEGINTLRIVKRKSDEIGVSMPLLNAAYNLLYGQGNMELALTHFISLEQKNDVEFSI